eukprot:TRINITY_DN17282_c0_g1_i1.p1 TRINITY_DN17282_c0_g1~~TRINITY_DN17282_c0_g1_i1.p1  ORF type:complete len:464 (-),score=105.73 TRINITY_DN17282_c0_g1_i1:28-1419(-)
MMEGEKRGEVDTAFEKRVVHKMIMRIIPFLFLMYVLSYLDRSNLGNAHSAMLEDTSITETDYAIGVSLFFVPYILFEIPSNLLLKLTTAPIWFSRIMVTWGIISVCMMFVRDLLGLIFLRLFLGLAEAGFLPGVVYYLALWFTPSERAFATGLFISAVPFSGMISGLAAYGILQMDGVLGLAGWQWLFLLEGIPSIIVGAIAWKILPASPDKCPWLNDQEKAFATKRLNSNPHNSPISSRDFKIIFSDLRLWLCAFNFLCICSSSYCISFFLPSIIEKFGFSTIISNILSASIQFIAFLALILNGLHSDRKNERFLHLLVPNIITLIGWGVAAYAIIEGARSDISTPLLVLQYMAVLLASAGTFMTFPIIITWSTEFYPPGSHEISLASAISVGVANFGGILGPQIMTIVRSLVAEEEVYGWGALGLSLTALLSVLLSCGAYCLTPTETEEVPLVNRKGTQYI